MTTDKDPPTDPNDILAKRHDVKSPAAKTQNPTVADAVDLYSEILGLPSGPRPPHFYELLGLELFCPHAESVDQSVRKAFRIVKPFHDHPDRDTRESLQDMMNHIATARVTLTNPDLKEAYDDALAAKLNINRDEFLASRVATPIPECQLSVIAGPSNVEERLELIEGTEITIGATRANTLVLPASGRMADRHATLTYENAAWTIRRASTERLIQVNDTPAIDFVLQPEDHIDLGGYRLRFGAIDRQIKKAPEPTRPGTSKKRVAPPISLIIQKGPTVAAPIFNALPPQRFLIGQSETTLWRLPAPTVQRHHCAIKTTGADWEIEGLGQDNLVTVNHRETMRHIFKDRDIITIPPFTILVSLRH
jgi:pSer/pThr/pTyr-binding forkhead associated (FHA) protein